MTEQTWNNCTWFGELNTCPKSKEKLMIQFRHDTTISDGPPPGNIFDSGKGAEINKTFCHHCGSFRPVK